MKEVSLTKYLNKYRNNNIDFFRFPGNYGDSLIWHGTINLLNNLNIKPKYVDLDSDIHNKVLFIDGGGNLVDYYSDVRNFIKKKHNLYKKIIILPHTINGNEQKSLLKMIGNNVIFLCREKISYNFVIKYAITCKVYLCHDCAFNNDLSPYKLFGNGILNAFRTDCESILKAKPKDNFDISYNAYCKKPLKIFLNEIAKYEEIRTDRLHVAIAATLLDKKVLLYSNSYYKNIAVYQYSLKKYPNIIYIYSDKKYILQFNNIKNAFNEYLTTNNKDYYNFLDLIKECILTNHSIWKFEDNIRMENISSKNIANTKRMIDTLNQQRNDLIGKIDANIDHLLKNKESNIKNYCSESPGMLIDRLSIFFIRLSILKKIILVIEDTEIKNGYIRKKQIVIEQINYLGKYLNLYFKNINNRKSYFKIFNPVKIYNDKKITDYIKKYEK